MRRATLDRSYVLERNDLMSEWVLCEPAPPQHNGASALIIYIYGWRRGWDSNLHNDLESSYLRFYWLLVANRSYRTYRNRPGWNKTGIDNQRSGG
jgi:hypothetical protein